MQDRHLCKPADMAAPPKAKFELLEPHTVLFCFTLTVYFTFIFYYQRIDDHEEASKIKSLPGTK